jgi:hypothetical protein
MDGQRFDRLARAVAAPRTRREALRGLVGAVAALVSLSRGKRVAAQQGWVPIGGACFNTGQCLQDGYGITVFCDDNGFTYDGQYNCCRYEGYCQADEHCCGESFCYQGQCTTTADDGYYRGPGEACFSDDQCLAASGALYCADNGFGYTACCAAEGDRCASHDGCCGYLGCHGGYCGYETGAFDGTLPLGAQCSSIAECEGGGYYTDCTNNGGFTQVCCLINGQGCSSDLDCCGMSYCVYQAAYRSSICI